MATSNLALVENAPQTSDEQSPRPNKYTYEEFDGPRGEEYLNVILQQVLPTALWRTWHWAVSFQAPGHPLYVSVGKLAERMRPGERKVYLDLQELEARQLLKITHTRMEIIQSDGSVTTRVVTIKNFERLYDLAHEYHEWIHSPDYLPAARECIDLIQASPQLVKKLIRFDNYRRLLLCHKPGRKPRPKEEHGWYAWSPDQEVTELQGSDQNHGTDDPKLNLYYNGRDKGDSPKRISIDSTSTNLLNKDSFNSEIPSKEGEESAKTNTCSQKRVYSRKDYTKPVTHEEHVPRLDNVSYLTSQTNPTNLSSFALGIGRARQSAGRESVELEPAVQQARRAMALVQGEQPGKVKRTYVGDGKPRPKDNEMVSSFISEFGHVLGDRNRKGSITGALRTVQASSLDGDIDILMCLVRAYVIARDTREVRPQHRHAEGDNRMPVFSRMFATFVEAWTAGNFHYTEEELIADIAADERLLNWVRERGLQPEVADHPATPQGEELVEAAIMQDNDRETINGHTVEVEATSSQGEKGSGSVHTSGMLMARRIRTGEEKEARKTYARQIRKTLRDAGVPEMLGAMVENEHSCGCPLFWDTERGWNWKCAHCKPHSGWNEEVREQIGSILEH